MKAVERAGGRTGEWGKKLMGVCGMDADRYNQVGTVATGQGPPQWGQAGMLTLRGKGGVVLFTVFLSRAFFLSSLSCASLFF